MLQALVECSAGTDGNSSKGRVFVVIPRPAPAEDGRVIT